MLPKKEAPLIPDHQVWSTGQLGHYVNENMGQEVYQTFIKREIHDVILDAVKRNSYHTRQVDGCFELYGADIGWYSIKNLFNFLILSVLDANLKPWLIEVNRCPSMATDNPVLQQMIPEMIENMIEIVVDKKLEHKAIKPNKFIYYDEFDYDVRDTLEVNEKPLTTNMPNDTSILSLLMS